MKKFNTIALAYLNNKNEIVAWSADTFGSPRNYPKTYISCEKNIDTLKNKFTSREKFAEEVVKLLGNHNKSGGQIMENSISKDKNIFEEKGIIKSQIYQLELITDYDKDLGSPGWDNIKNCINNKKYKLLI